MKKIILSLMFALGLSANATNINNLNKINEKFNTINLNIPAEVYCYYADGYRVSIRTNDTWLKNNLNMNLNNDTINIFMDKKYGDIYDIPHDKVIIKVYSPDIPNIEVSNRNLCVASSIKKSKKCNTKNEN